MRLLILGAGATGGYYGGRLASAGVDVTFLVRPKRAAELAAHGLAITSPRGDIKVPVKTVTANALTDGYDAVILSAKAYDLESAIDAIRRAVGATTKVLPLLNGMSHLDQLDTAFGPERVLGGTCHISVTLADGGVIRHMSPFDAMTFGARHPENLPFCRDLATVLGSGGFEVRLSENIIGAMWEKWVLLATLAGTTCLMRANIGEIARVAGGRELVSDMLDECCRVATANGDPPRPAVIDATRATLTDPASSMSASMRRDLEAGGRIEADHIIGDLKARADRAGIAVPLLAIAYAHLQAYQNRLDPVAKSA